MKILLGLASIAAALNLVGCVNYAEEEEARDQARKKQREEFNARHQKQLADIKRHYQPREQSEAEKALIKKKSVYYYQGLLDTIRQIDDGKSDASTVARAAVSRNIERLRDWKRADLDRFRIDSETSLKVDRGINDLPSQNLLDEAASIVLELRQKKSPARTGPTTEEQGRYLEYLKRLKYAEEGA